MLCFGKKKSSDEEETRRPSNSKFKQQKLPAWQPILTASTVLPVFFLIGIVFLPVGIALLVSSNNVKEMVIEYSTHENCKDCRDELEKDGLSNFKNGIPINCNCTIDFDLDTKWEGDVYFYYGLSNFYQNHRRYVRSRDDNQLHGDLKKTVNSNCEPFDKNSSGFAYAPCGAVANSMFTDRFEITKMDMGESVPLIHKDIAWKSDRETKFKNPSSLSEFKNFLKPKYWTKSVTELDTETKNDANNGFVNQDFIVWMRVAAFPTFRKLYRKLDRSKSKFRNGLSNGKYQLRIYYNYPVESFGGKKRFILTTSSWIGGKNSFLGIAYIIVGCFCLIFGFIFLVIHMKVRTKPLMN
ncbi:cell cycle control protein 50A-like [Hydractinia symbiolongicarpus]|uniref:cell cycle control protein 50A-like n=1 Tax=Hydractinia symbiolongicarpus TaxID=13093 RepID=UPI00254D1129|nr:cell cycle control protein 50A-like [Hydractinia symbiolongicarpus]